MKGIIAVLVIYNGCRYLMWVLASVDFAGAVACELVELMFAKVDICAKSVLMTTASASAAIATSWQRSRFLCLGSLRAQTYVKCECSLLVR